MCVVQKRVESETGDFPYFFFLSPSFSILPSSSHHTFGTLYKNLSLPAFVLKKIEYPDPSFVIIAFVMTFLTRSLVFVSFDKAKLLFTLTKQGF